MRFLTVPVRDVRKIPSVSNRDVRKILSANNLGARSGVISRTGMSSNGLHRCGPITSHRKQGEGRLGFEGLPEKCPANRSAKGCMEGEMLLRVLREPSSGSKLR